MPHWKKLGRIFEWGPSPARSTTHAQVPTVLVKENVVRVYFAPRNTKGRSYPAYIDLDRGNLTRVVEVHEQPVMEPGRPGMFDDDGIMPACVMDHAGEIWMYYSGWNQRITVPYHNSTGLAVSTDGGNSFKRKFEGPVMDRTPEEPGLAVTPSILRDGDTWMCWYISGLRWEQINGKFEPVYVIKHAHSTDGIRWTRPNILCIEQKHPLEAFSHPTVIRHDGIYHMWYCCRHSQDFRDGDGSYRIGYARSADGRIWTRMDDAAGITLSDSGWDSTMLCYPYVLDIDGKTYMFYNGNGFGQSGIGLAVLESW